MTKAKLPQTPQNLLPYVDVLGIDGAVAFLLEFGGAEVWYPSGSSSTSELAQVLGPEKARALAGRATQLKARVPVAKRWIAQVLHARGLSNAQIARKLHTTDVTVRKYLAQKYTCASAFSDQPDLFK